MPFDASKTDLPRLDYDFRPLYNASGRSPEPSPQAVRKFQMKIRNTASLLGRDDLDVNDTKAMQKFMESLTEEDMEKIDEELFGAIADMFDQRPSKEEMLGLYNASYRYGIEYGRSVMEDVLDPKRGNRDI